MYAFPGSHLVMFVVLFVLVGAYTLVVLALVHSLAPRFVLATCVLDLALVQSTLSFVLEISPYFPLD